MACHCDFNNNGRPLNAQFFCFDFIFPMVSCFRYRWQSSASTGKCSAQICGTHCERTRSSAILLPVQFYRHASLIPGPKWKWQRSPVFLSVGSTAIKQLPLVIFPNSGNWNWADLPSISHQCHQRFPLEQEWGLVSELDFLLIYQSRKLGQQMI